jgi:hypothetical protein
MPGAANVSADEGILQKPLRVKMRLRWVPFSTLQSNDVIWLSSGSEVFQNAKVDAGVDSDSTLDSTGVLDIDDLITIHSRQKQHQKSVSLVLTAPSSSQLARARKPTAKQASQNRRAIEKQRRKKAKTKRVDTTPYRSMNCHSAVLNRHVKATGSERLLIYIHSSTTPEPLELRTVDFYEYYELPSNRSISDFSVLQIGEYTVRGVCGSRARS